VVSLCTPLSPRLCVACAPDDLDIGAGHQDEQTPVDVSHIETGDILPLVGAWLATLGVSFHTLHHSRIALAAQLLTHGAGCFPSCRSDSRRRVH
jgi:hypothetical protein